MNRAILVAAIAGGVFTVGSVASAATYNYTVAPSDVTVDGTTPFVVASGDLSTGASMPVGSQTTGAPGWGGSSFVSSVDGSTSHYVQLNFDVNKLFQTTDLTIGDLKQITYYSKDNGNGGQWYLRIYTQATTTGSWYEHRFDGAAINGANSNWQQLDTDGNANIVAIDYKGTNANDPTGGDKSGLTDTLEDLHSVYGAEKIFSSNLSIGGSTNSLSIANNLDGLVVELMNGDVARVNFVPEPASLGLLAIGGLALLGRRRRRC